MSNENKNRDNKSTQVAQSTDASRTDSKSGINSKMETVKSAWDKAPEGAKKDNALKHYQSAEKAQKSGNEAEAMRELEEATRALN